MRTLVRDKANLVAESGDWVRRMQKSLDQPPVGTNPAAGRNCAAAESTRNPLLFCLTNQ